MVENMYKNAKKYLGSLPIQNLIDMFSQFIEYQYKDKWEKRTVLIEHFKEKFNELHSKNIEDLQDSQSVIGSVWMIALYQILERENLTLDEFEQFVLRIYQYIMDPKIQETIVSYRTNSDPWKLFVETTVVDIKASYGDFFELEILQADDKALNFNIHKCHYHEVFQKNGFPELCPIRCAYDWIHAKSLDKWVKFERDKTIANGDTQCTFRYYPNPMEPKYKIYLYPSIISALFDDGNPERKSITESFFEEFSDKFEIYISDVTVAEIEKTPDEEKKKRMKEKIAEFPILKISDEIEDLSEELIYRHAIGELYHEDAYHVAIALINGMDILLYWDFRYWKNTVQEIIINHSKGMIKMTSQLNGLRQLAFCTPEEI